MTIARPSGTPGRKPIRLDHLVQQEQEWYAALNYLREGFSLPIHPLARWLRYQHDDRDRARRLHHLDRMSLHEYWAEYLSHEPTPPRPPDWQPPPLSTCEAHVERLQRDEIAWLSQWSDALAIRRRSEGRQIWEALWRADTLPALAAACRRWIAWGRRRVADATRQGRVPNGEDDLTPFTVLPVSPFPVRVLDHAPQVLAMKRDRQFPKSDSADRSRVTFLARGMAGLEIGVSPLTAIERLRTMTHGPGGPFWHPEAQRCGCWRCGLQAHEAFWERLGEAPSIRAGGS